MVNTELTSRMRRDAAIYEPAPPHTGKRGRPRTKGERLVYSRDVKQYLGGEDPQSWKRNGPERAAALALWLRALTWCWYLDTLAYAA